MRARIHRGAHEVGGNCIEVESAGTRLVLDLGRPLTASLDTEVPLPAVPGLREDGEDRLGGLLITHPHLDHCGLAAKIAPSVPIFIGEAADRILQEAAFFTPAAIALKPAGFLRHRETFRIGSFQVTPFLNDHSAFDAYSLLLEAGGRRLFYTGDLRGHGRKAALFDELLREPPREVDVLLMEGTHIGPGTRADDRGASETDVENECIDAFRATKGMILALYSPQNIDRLVTFYRAAVRSGRILVMDLYTAGVAAATGRETIPQASWDKVRVYVPQAQRAKVLREQAFERTQVVRPDRIYPEELASRPGDLVLTFRLSMARELQAAGCLGGSAAVWSMWPGYLKEPSGRALREFLDRLGIPLTIHHASGHAFVPDLRRLVESLAPRRVVPIHTFAGDRFEDFFPRVEPHRDGEWWEV